LSRQETHRCRTPWSSLCRALPDREFGSDQEDTIDIIRFQFVRDITAIDDDPLHTGRPGQIDEPAQGFPLNPPRLTGRRIYFVDEGRPYLG